MGCNEYPKCDTFTPVIENCAICVEDYMNEKDERKGHCKRCNTDKGMIQ